MNGHPVMCVYVCVCVCVCVCVLLWASSRLLYATLQLKKFTKRNEEQVLPSFLHRASDAPNQRASKSCVKN